ncbi:CAP-associated domain-containing protein [Bacillus sp. DX4.1]|uniref:CAP domain-containing protein n=1 Tax=Bacillus sp. DX4.1 TaxID=3055867 RepID=UPI0025A0495F|nr:CAP domain-containing protein [Bacillus sp. DX4.1]MDM5189645.1 CAP-associated domain-containing protein [Bacillus sp. DX4.1]
MKKLLRIVIITIFILAIDLYGKLLVSQYILQPSHSKQEQKIVKKKQQTNEEFPETISQLIGGDSENLLARWGEPARIEPSAYGYEWWIYNQDLSRYVQFGIAEHKIVTAYAAGDQVDIAPFHMNEKYEEVYKKNSFSHEISLKKGRNSYQFELSDTEIVEQPLVSMEKGGWAQLYFDHFTHELVGIRYMDDEILVQQRPYQLVYSGELKNAQPLSAEKMTQVEHGNMQQILDLTNIIRSRHQLSLLTWDQRTAEVAFGHSKDMKENNYFSHDSPKFGTLGDRLQRGQVAFQLAGENIAAQHNDGIAAMHGWLNSEGHRKNLLNEQFTELGVGVYDKFYTQNFIRK